MKKEHILVIRFSAIGDVAMTVPVVYSLARQYPDVHITMLSRAFARPMFEGLAPNVSFMEADLKGEYRGVKGLNALFRRLAAKHFTKIADLHNVLRSEYLRMRFNIGFYRVEHVNKMRQERRALTAHNNKVKEQLPSSFQNYADVFAKLGYPVDLSFRSIFGQGRGDLTQLPAAIGTKPEGQLWIGIAPTAAHPNKEYPLQKMDDVMARLSERYPQARFFLFGRGEREDRLFSEWCSQYRQATYVAQHVDGLRQELSLMSHLDVMLSMDSANMHLASLTATPVVSLWGPTHPYAGFMGWGQSLDNVLQAELDCRPCSIYGNRPCQRGDLACMNSISPDDVVKKIATIIDPK